MVFSKFLLLNFNINSKMSSQLTETSLKNIKKDDLVKICWNYVQRMDNMTAEISALRLEIADLKNSSVSSASVIASQFGDRVMKIERNLSQQLQYSRRECVEFVNVPESIPQKDLEAKVIDMFAVAGTKVYPRDFHAVHRIRGKTVIVKLVNRKDASFILRNKKELRNLSEKNRGKLGVGANTKIFVNESLCPYYRFLFGKCNALFKGNHISASYTMNGVIKIVTNNVLEDGTSNPVGGVTQNIGHLNDLYNLFGSELIDSLVKDS